MLGYGLDTDGMADESRRFAICREPGLDAPMLKTDRPHLERTRRVAGDEGASGGGRPSTSQGGAMATRRPSLPAGRHHARELRQLSKPDALCSPRIRPGARLAQARTSDRSEGHAERLAQWHSSLAEQFDPEPAAPLQEIDIRRSRQPLGGDEDCTWLSTRERKKYRLPTEAEWNMQPGTDGRRYRGGTTSIAAPGHC